MQHEHCADPGSPTRVAPQCPWHCGEFRVLRLLCEFIERLQEFLFRAVPRVAPQPAVFLLRLLVGWPEQRALVHSCQRLPVQIKSRSLPRPARAFAASMLMHNHPTQRVHTRWNPHGVAHAEDEFARLCRGLVTHAEIWRVRRRQRRLRVQRDRADGEEYEGMQCGFHRWKKVHGLEGCGASLSR